MRPVKIADDVYAALQAMAVPFEDDINDVLRRLLKVADQHNDRRANCGPPASGEARALAVVDQTAFEVDDGARLIVHRRGEGNSERLPQSTYRSAVLGVLKSTNGNGVEAVELLRDIE